MSFDQNEKENDLTFWQHLDILRKYIFRCVAVWLALFVVVFCLKETLFDILLQPSRSNFIIFHFFPQWQPTDIPLINTGLAQQFIVHLQMSLAVSGLLAAPFFLYQVILFISPALYAHEKHVAFPALIMGILMFFIGIAFTYFILFPFVVHFLGTYQVSESVANYIVLDSYISTLLLLGFTMGILFEMPLLCLVLGKMDILSAETMRKYRRHAIVLILILAAVITPTGDAFTLFLMAIPLYLLYEVSIFLVHNTQKKTKTLE